jgi:hypothetical protein
MAQVYSGTLQTFSIAGGSQLEFVRDAEISIPETQAEGAPASRFGGNTQGLKRGAMISGTLMSDSSTDIRVSHLNVSAGTLGAVNLLSPNILNSLTLGINMTHQPKAGVGQLWQTLVVADGLFDASLTLDFDGTAAPALLVDMFSGTYANLNKVLDFTVGGVQIQIPFRMREASIPVGKGEKQTYTLGLSDRSARSGVTVLPSGTSSLLEKAINQPKSSIAFAFQGAGASNISISGNMVWQRYQLQIQDSGLVLATASWLSFGTVTGTGVA